MRSFYRVPLSASKRPGAPNPSLPCALSESRRPGALARVLACALSVPLLPAAAFDFTPRSGAPDSLHPDFTLVSLLPADAAHRVIGMDWLPGGDMAVLTLQDTVMPSAGGGHGWVHILSGARGAPASPTSLRTVYHGFEMPMGLAAAGPDIHVSQRESLVRLADSDGDGTFDSLVRVAAYPDAGPDGGFGRWAMNLRYRDGKFYTGLGAYHFIDGDGPCMPYPERGLVHAVDAQGRVESWGRGLREPNGIGFGPEGELFATDNDGEWVAANKLVHVRKDGFYGLVPCGSWDPALAFSPPAAWLPQHMHSPGQPLLLSGGTFRGQMLIGDYWARGLVRVSLEKVDGNHQGAVFPFTGGLASGGLRLLSDESGAIYVGELTIDSYEGWWVNAESHPAPGAIEKLIPKAGTAFEMLAIRALPGGFELEFTRPVGPEAADPSGYRVRQWRYLTSKEYGSAKFDLEQIPVAAARLAEDRKRVFLSIPGLKADRVVHLQLHDGFRAADGGAPWAYEAWYTLNALPGSPGRVGAPAASPSGPRVALRRAGGIRSVSVDLPGPATLLLSDPAGRPVFRARAEGRRELALPASLPAGVYALRVMGRGFDLRRAFPVY